MPSSPGRDAVGDDGAYRSTGCGPRPLARRAIRHRVARRADSGTHGGVPSMRSPRHLSRCSKAPNKALEPQSMRADEMLEDGIGERRSDLSPAGFHLQLTLGAATGPRSPSRVVGAARRHRVRIPRKGHMRPTTRHVCLGMEYASPPMRRDDAIREDFPMRLTMMAVALISGLSLAVVANAAAATPRIRRDVQRRVDRKARHARLSRLQESCVKAAISASQAAQAAGNNDDDAANGARATAACREQSPPPRRTKALRAAFRACVSAG